MTKIISDEELIRLYAEPGRGYTDQELGDRFGVGREAIFKRRTKSLALEYPFKPTERGRWRIDTEKLTSHIRVSLKQALALYLPARRVSRSTPLPKGVVREALSKLAPTLYNLWC